MQQTLSWKEKLKDVITQKYGSLGAFYQGTGFPRKTLENYLNRDRVPASANARRLYELTRVEELQLFYQVDKWYKDLLQWLEENRYTRTRFAKEIGTIQPTVSAWTTGSVKNPFLIKDDLRKKAYQITGLKWFAPVDKIPRPRPEIQVKPEELVTPDQLLESLRDNLFNVVRFLESARPSSEEWKSFLSQTTTPPQERASNITALVKALIKELEYYKNGDDSARKLLTEGLHPRTVGYLTAMLNALYSEQEWKRFVLSGVFRIR